MLFHYESYPGFVKARIEAEIKEWQDRKLKNFAVFINRIMSFYLVHSSGANEMPVSFLWTVPQKSWHCILLLNCARITWENIFDIMKSDTRKCSLQLWNVDVRSSEWQTYSTKPWDYRPLIQDTEGNVVNQIVNVHRGVVESPKDKFEVFYIDYGNQEVVAYSQLRPLDSSVSSSPGLAQLCSLAYVKVPGLEENYRQEAGIRLSEHTLNGPKEFTAVIVERDTSGGKVKGQGTGTILMVTLVDVEANTSINALMLKLAAPLEVGGWHRLSCNCKNKLILEWIYNLSGRKLKLLSDSPMVSYTLLLEFLAVSVSFN